MVTPKLNPDQHLLFQHKEKKPTVTVVKKERKKIAAINLEEKFDDLD